MATRVRAGRSDKAVMGASRSGSYKVTATRPDVRTGATGRGGKISAKTARRRSALRVRPHPMAPRTSTLSGPRRRRPFDMLPALEELPRGDECGERRRGSSEAEGDARAEELGQSARQWSGYRARASLNHA